MSRKTSAFWWNDSGEAARLGFLEKEFKSLGVTTKMTSHTFSPKVLN